MLHHRRALDRRGPLRPAGGPELRYGLTRFQDIAASTGAPRDVLTSRLRKLELADVIERRRYSEHPTRYEYLLTEAGRELQPILLALKEWDRHRNPGAEPVIFQGTCGAAFHPLTVCAACRAPLRDGELTVTGATTRSKQPCTAGIATLQD